MDAAFNLPVLLGMVPVWLILRVGWRFLCSAIFSLKPTDSKKMDVVDALFYAVSLCLGIGIGEAMTKQESWRSNYDDCYIGYPNQEISWELKFYYTYCLGFYLYQVAGHFFLDTKKKDFIAMLVHHLVTIALITLSGMNFMHKIGTVIMLTFDVCDVLLEMARIFHKLDYHNATLTFFVSFTASWFRNRLFIYYLYILPSTFRAQVIAGQSIPYYYFCEVCLVVIGILQAYWSIFIVKKVFTVVMKGIAAEGDPREESIKKEKEKKKD